jgi:hypothetical protein
LCVHCYVIPTPFPPGTVHALISPMHIPTSAVLLSFYSMHVDYFCAFPADVSLTAPVDENIMSSSTLIDPEIVNVLSLCEFSAASELAALQAQHSVSQLSFYCVSGVDSTD